MVRRAWIQLLSLGHRGGRVVTWPYPSLLILLIWMKKPQCAVWAYRLWKVSRALASSL